MKRNLFALIACLLSVGAGSNAAAQSTDASGSWAVEVNAPDGVHKATLTLKKVGDKLTGTIGESDGALAVEGTQKGADVSVKFDYPGDTPIVITLKGEQKGDAIAGPATFGTDTGTWSGTRSAPSGDARPAAPPTAGALDISGAWLFEVTSPAGTGTPTITFNQSGETITGKYVGQLGEAPVQGTLKGSDLSFSFDVTVQDVKLHVVYTGTVTKDAMKGTASFGEMGEGTFTAHRK